MQPSDPARSAFDTYHGYRLALARLFGSSRQEVVMLDEDLRASGLQTRAGAEVMQAFLAGAGRLRIALADWGFLQQDCPRLMSLYATYRHAMCVRAIPDHLRQLSECYAVGDARHTVVRFHKDHARGVSVLGDDAQALPWLRRFDDLWQECRDELPLTPLGL